MKKGWERKSGREQQTEQTKKKQQPNRKKSKATEKNGVRRDMWD
jgi:hypothetical protein